MNWSDTSEVVLGLILDKRLSANAVTPDMFVPPYDKAIKLIKNNPGISIEDVIMQTGLSPVQDAFEVVHRMNGLGEKNWVQILQQSRSLYDAGSKFARWSKKLTDGDNIDWAELRGLVNTVESEYSEDFTPLNQITDEAMPFIPTGWKAIDDHVVGLPEVGMVVIGGLSGSGKTTAICRLVGSFSKQHVNKKIAFFSLEMMKSEVGPRLRSLMTLSEEEQRRIDICDKSLTIPEIISRAASVDNLGLVVIDFIDLAISGEINVSTTSQAYIELAKAAKSLHCPIVVIAQLVDVRGIPKPQHIRFTRLSWALSWMIWMIYDPATSYPSKQDKENFDESDTLLPVVDGRAYIIVWKVRGGFKKHQDEAPGAIMIPFEGKRGWHPTESKWFSLKKME